jgi:hypothetical protein
MTDKCKGCGAGRGCTAYDGCLCCGKCRNCGEAHGLTVAPFVVPIYPQIIPTIQPYMPQPQPWVEPWWGGPTCSTTVGVGTIECVAYNTVGCAGLS